MADRLPAADSATPKAISSGGLALGMWLLAAGCGGGSPGSPSPSPSPSPLPSPAPAGSATITITASGASPRSVTVTQGGRVTFVNNDSRPHEMTSDPHPSHTDCPEINQAGFLSPGESRATGNLTTVRSCGYHDHLNETNSALQSTITITAP